MNRHPYATRPAAPCRPTHPVISYLFVGVLAVLATLGLVHWLVSCWQAGPEAMCSLLVPALPLRTPLRRGWQRWRMWCNTRRMAETERQISQYRRLLADDRLKLESLRDMLADQQRLQLLLASGQ